MNTIVRKSYFQPPICEKEILRYAGCKKATDEVISLMHTALEEVRDRLSYRVCYREFPIKIEDGVCDLGFARVDSAALAKNLEGCESIVIFGATVGLELDRLIAKYGKTAPSRALMLQAIGAERIEALCDMFCSELEEEKGKAGLFLKPRFSPGYGDLPLELQGEIFSVLDCPRQIGLTLNSSMLMSPSKSVTAIVGVSSAERRREKNKCSMCEKADCTFRSI